MNNKLICNCDCDCDNLRRKCKFKDWDDYERFKLTLKNQSFLEEIEVLSHYADIGLSEIWLRCCLCRIYLKIVLAVE